MDNENKELELEAQELEPVAENDSVEVPEFDPTESEDFYNNLEAAIGAEDDFNISDLPELSLPEDTFILDEAEQPVEESFEDEMFAGVDAALSEQIEQEFGSVPEASVTEEKEPNRFVACWSAIPTWSKVLVGVILALLVSVGLLFGTAKGRELLINIAVEWAFGKVQVDETPTPTPEPTGAVTPEPTAEPTPGPSSAPTPEPTTDPDMTPGPTIDPDISPEATTEACLWRFTSSAILRDAVIYAPVRTETTYHTLISRLLAQATEKRLTDFSAVSAPRGR